MVDRTSHARRPRGPNDDRHLSKSAGRLPRCAVALALLSLATLLLARGARAQQKNGQAPSEEPVIRLPEISVTGPARLPETLPRSWVPNAVDVIPGAEISGTRPLVLPDVMQRSPGVTLQSEQGNTFQPSLTLRGFAVSPV